jgi:hypothetical protein
MGGCVQTTLHMAAIPVSTSMVHRSPSSGHVVGQLPSQLSGAVTTPSPQRAAQSASFPMLQVPPAGQQPSPVAHWLMVTRLQAAVHVAALPVSESTVQAFASLHEASVGQEPGGSHVSPASGTPFPQLTEQSLSVLLLQPAGQQPSPLAH